MSTLDHDHNCLTCSKKAGGVLCNASDEHLCLLSDKKVHTNYKKGQIIFNEGHYPYGLYCINSGKIKISHSGDDGKEMIVRLAKEGDVIGYKALLSNNKYTASAVALEDSSVCFIPKEAFIHVVSKDINFSLALMKMLSDELRKAETKVTHLAQKPVRERMAEALLFIRQTYGTESDGLTLNVTLSRDEIANIVGTATESAIRLLSDFKKEGLIELVGKKIKISNEIKLLKTANLQD